MLLAVARCPKEVRCIGRQTNARACTLTRSYIRSCIHAYGKSIHSFIHSFSQSVSRSVTQSLIHSYIHSFIHPDIHPSIHPSIHTCIHTQVHVHTQSPYPHPLTPPHTHSHPHTPTHPHTLPHTPTHVHTHTPTHSHARSRRLTSPGLQASLQHAVTMAMQSARTQQSPPRRDARARCRWRVCAGGWRRRFRSIASALPLISLKRPWPVLLLPSRSRVG